MTVRDVAYLSLVTVDASPRIITGISSGQDGRRYDDFELDTPLQVWLSLRPSRHATKSFPNAVLVHVVAECKRITLPAMPGLDVSNVGARSLRHG